MGHEEHARALGLQPQSLKDRWGEPGSAGSLPGHERESADALLVLELPATLPIEDESPSWRRSSGRPPCRGRLVGRGGGSLMDQGHQGGAALGGLCGRIVKGAQPADLPFEVVVRPELIVNFKTAQEIGVTIRQRCSSGRTGSYNEGISDWLDNRLARAAEQPPAADCLQRPLLRRSRFRQRLRRSGYD